VRTQILILLMASFSLREQIQSTKRLLRFLKTFIYLEAYGTEIIGNCRIAG
jgi:hypothetical protein